VSLYYGVSAGLQLLNVSFLSIALQSNTFANCSVRASVEGGNAYGGALSLHIGAYSSAFNSTGDAAAAVGDTVVRNVNVTLDTVDFTSCSVIRENLDFSLFGTKGANVYGGSFSFHIGAYALSYSSSGGSNSTCGATSASGIRVLVQNTTSVNSRAVTNHVTCQGANSYGGSMSVLHVGAYSWSLSDMASSNSNSDSTCGATTASDVSVHVSGSGCSNCSAITSTDQFSNGANSYGGSMSVLHVGAYSWSLSSGAKGNSDSTSTCKATTASDVSVHVSGSGCSNCIAITSGTTSHGANSYGGSMSVLHVGAYAWSYSLFGISNSNSTCETTTSSDVAVHVSDSGCNNCSAITTSKEKSHGASSYGGSMSVLHVGAYSWSLSDTANSNSDSTSTCKTTSASSKSISRNSISTSGATTASDVSVHVNGSGCSNCSAITSTFEDSYGANSYGGSMSVLHVGAYSWSLSNTANSNSGSTSTCKTTSASDVSVHVSGSGCVKCSAISTTALSSYGANSYGGALSAVFIGAYSYSSAAGSFFSFSRAIVESTEVVRLSVTIQDSTIVDAVAASGEYCRMRSIPIRTGLTFSFRIRRRRIRCQCECFL
jgi:hypothetical protein